MDKKIDRRTQVAISHDMRQKIKAYAAMHDVSIYQAANIIVAAFFDNEDSWIDEK